MSSSYDAVVVGSGPNGLAAAVEIARSGRSVLVLEAADVIGGSTRTRELTLPGFLHDVCSGIHPAGVSSPFLRDLPLEEHGLEWIQPQLPLAHPLDGGSAALLHRPVDQTADELGVDGPAYRRLMSHSAERWKELADYALGPLLRVPRHPVTVARFGRWAMLSASRLVGRFQTHEARALLAGLAAHSIAPLEQPFTAAIGLGLAAAAHAVGWPAAMRGSQAIANALGSYLESLGGEIRTGSPVNTLDELPPAGAVFLSVTPAQFLAMAGSRLPGRYRRGLERFRYGPAVFKVDWALDAPIPWTAPECSVAGTVHVGGTFEEIAAAERRAWEGQIPDRPFVILAQHSVFDPSRAPVGRHTAWGYCHVPNGSTADMTEAIEAQIERFAPGFKDRILGRHTMGPVQMERFNPNHVGGDISGGALTIRQLLFRPTARLDPYRTPLPGVYLCGSSTPPGAGVHGMCGYRAARSALRRELSGVGPGPR